LVLAQVLLVLVKKHLSVSAHSLNFSASLLLPFVASSGAAGAGQEASAS
jgi:hypothetical protein